MHINKIGKYYFINKFDTNNIDKQDKQTTIIYRNYSKKNVDQTLILKIKKYCKKKSINFYLSNNVRLAIKLNLDGAYIPSFNNSLKHLSYSYKKNFKLIGSAHNLKEIKVKENQNVNKIFLSSLFKKNKNFLGMNKFKLLSKLTQKDIVALGGISKKIKKNSLFWVKLTLLEYLILNKKKAPKKGPF
jgi:thiamine-phosphate pyrophosphorylase